MLTKLDEINLINAANTSDYFLTENFIRSESEFEDFDISSRGLPLLVAADPKVFTFRPKDMFRISNERILNKIYQIYRTCKRCQEQENSLIFLWGNF